MKPISIVVIGGNNDLRRLVEEAAHLAFSSVVVTSAGSMDEACHQPTSTTVDLVVWADPDPEGTDQAATSPGMADGVRPWPVVVLGRKAEWLESEVIPPGEWEKHLLARAFRSAIERYQLTRKLLLLQGDLLTIGLRINHDLRTPLGCILTSAEMLEEMILDKAPSEAPLSRTILRSAEELLKLIEKVSFVAKASAQPLPKERVNMGVPFLSALQRLEWQATKQKVAIEQPAAWPEVAGVESWLEAMWWNLISNALQYGGSSAGLETGWDHGAGENRFWVVDHGQGVPLEQRPLLFTPFHRLYEPNAGRGVGLAIVQRLAELQGGNCGYEPRSGGGSQFYFTLPELG